MKNSLSDLNNHLFEQLERLNDEELEGEALDREAKRAESIVAVADQIIRNAALQVQAAKIAFDAGVDPVQYLPAPALKADSGPQKMLSAASQPKTAPAPAARFPVKAGERAP